MTKHNDLEVLLEMAVALRWYLFPTYGSRYPAEAKRPALHLVPRWSRDSTDDYGLAEEWVRRGYGLGLDCGRSDMVMLDADRPHAIPKGLDLSDALVLQGDRSRYGLLFRQPEDVRIGCAAGAWGPAGEVKGDGGYAVMPPSPHPTAGLYRWLRTGTSMIMPDSVKQLWLPERPAPPAGGKPENQTQTMTPGDACRRIREVGRRYSSALSNPIGSRHDIMRSAMAEIMRLGMQGHEGSEGALKVLRISYLLSARGDRRRELDAEREFQNLLRRTPAFLAMQDIRPEICGGPACR